MLCTQYILVYMRKICIKFCLIFMKIYSFYHKKMLVLIYCLLFNRYINQVLNKLKAIGSIFNDFTLHYTKHVIRYLKNLISSLNVEIPVLADIKFCFLNVNLTVPV